MGAQLVKEEYYAKMMKKYKKNQILPIDIQNIEKQIQEEDPNFNIEQFLQQQNKRPLYKKFDGKKSQLKKTPILEEDQNSTNNQKSEEDIDNLSKLFNDQNIEKNNNNNTQQAVDSQREKISSFEKKIENRRKSSFLSEQQKLRQQQFFGASNKFSKNKVININKLMDLEDDSDFSISSSSSEKDNEERDAEFEDELNDQINNGSSVSTSDNSKKNLNMKKQNQQAKKNSNEKKVCFKGNGGQEKMKLLQKFRQSRSLPVDQIEEEKQEQQQQQKNQIPLQLSQNSQQQQSEQEADDQYQYVDVQDIINSFRHPQTQFNYFRNRHFTESLMNDANEIDYN